MTVDITKAKVVLDKFTEASRVTGDRDVFEKAELYLGIDHSGSMSRYFSASDKPVVELAKRVLALGLARLDPDGVIPMWFYANNLHGPVNVTEAGLYPRGVFNRQDVVTQEAARAPWGGTRTELVVRAIMEEHLDTQLVKPGLAVIQTDGQPNFEQPVIDALVEASRINLFYVFIGFGRDGEAFLERLNEGGFEGQLVDNVYTFNADDRPRGVDPDEWLYTELLKEVPRWRAAADGRVRGIV